MPNSAAASCNHPNWASSVSRVGSLLLALVPNPCRMAGRIKVRLNFHGLVHFVAREHANAHFQVKMHKAHHGRTTFGSGDVEKVHAVVARSTFPSQTVQNTPCSDHFWKLRCRKSARRCGAKHMSKLNVQNTSGSDHFWKLRCRKSARRCGAKHISKSKCAKHTMLGPLLEVAMSKKCTPLWREAHFQVKMYKTPGVRTTFGS